MLEKFRKINMYPSVNGISVPRKLQTDSGQKYSDASSFLYIFHINLQFNFFLFWSQFISDCDNFLIDSSKIESS
jgi:hypothetical protein